MATPSSNDVDVTGAGTPRRTLLKAGAIGAAGIGAASALGLGAPAAAAQHAVFGHGIASGDPMADRVILWTRVTPTPDAHPGSGAGPAATVRWEVSHDAAFGAIVASGTTSTDSGRDHTVNVDATGLAADSWYFYRFHCNGQVSPTGRTRTAPAPGTHPGRARFGVVSCANWEAGHFGGYRALSERGDLDAIIELGDYIYEYGVGEYGGKLGTVREHDPAWEIVSLSDYRRRHAQYRTDPALQALHAHVPWICTWDDHEIANDAWADGADNHSPSEGDYHARRAAGAQAYFEWLPIRPQHLREGGQLYRRLSWGSLAEINMLDLRSFRSLQAGMTDGRAIDDPNRTMTGAAQFDWLTRGLTSSNARWNVVGNSVMIAPVLLPPLDPRVTQALTDLLNLPQEGLPYNPDQWDGYQAERRRLFDVIDSAGLDNCVFLTGDIHTSWACDLPRRAASPAEGLVGAEFVVPSITSSNIDDILADKGLVLPESSPLTQTTQAALMTANRHVRFVDLDRHGFGVFELTEAFAHMDYFAVVAREDPNTPVYPIGSWRKPHGPGPIEPAGLMP